METIATLKAQVEDLKTTAANEKAEHDAEKAAWKAKQEASEAKAQDAITKVGALEAEVALLKNKGEASQAELDALGVSIGEAKTAVSGIVVADEEIPAIPSA